MGFAPAEIDAAQRSDNCSEEDAERDPTPIPIAAPADRPLVGSGKTGPAGVFSDGSIEDKEDYRIDVSRVLVEAIEVAVTEFSPLGIVATPASKDRLIAVLHSTYTVCFGVKMN